MKPFQTVVKDTPLPNAFSKLAKLDQEKTCQLSYAADMLLALTDGMVKMDQVHQFKGTVIAANLSESVSIPFIGIGISIFITIGIGIRSIKKKERMNEY